MKTSGTWNFRSVVCKIMMGFFFATMIIVIDAAPALARDRGYYETVDGERVYRPYRYRKHKERRNRGYYETVNGRRVYRTYRYSERVYVEPPVYVPPPVYYEPPAPGIRLFLPSINIH